MFHNPLELEQLVKDRVAGREHEWRQLARRAPAASNRSAALPRRGKQALGRGLIAVGERLAERPAAPIPSRRVAMARTR